MRDANKNAELAKIIRKKYGLPNDLTACFLQGYLDNMVPFPIYKLFCKELGEDYVNGMMTEETKSEYLMAPDEKLCLRSNDQYCEVMLMDQSFEHYGWDKGEILLVDKSKKHPEGLIAVEVSGHIMLTFAEKYPELHAVRFSFGCAERYPDFYWPDIYRDKIGIVGQVVLYTDEKIEF